MNVDYLVMILMSVTVLYYVGKVLVAMFKSSQK